MPEDPIKTRKMIHEVDDFPIRSTRIIHSEELLQGAKEVVIKHCREYYRLLVTKAGKLILNK